MSNPFSPIIKELQNIVNSLDNINDKSNVVLDKAEKILDKTNPILNKADNLLNSLKTIERLLYVLVISFLAVLFGWFVTWFITKVLKTYSDRTRKYTIN